MPTSFLSPASCTGWECPSGHGPTHRRLWLPGCVHLFSSSPVHGFGFPLASPEICGNAPVPLRHQDSVLKAVCLSPNTSHISSIRDGSNVPFCFVCRQIPGEWKPLKLHVFLPSGILTELRGSPRILHLVVLRIVLYSHLPKPQSEVTCLS